MSPEIIVGVLQFGAMGLLAVTLYFGLQANARMIEILAEALKRCQEDKAIFQERLSKLEEKL